MGKPIFGNNYITFEKNSFYLDKTPITNLQKCYKTPFFVFLVIHAGKVPLGASLNTALDRANDHSTNATKVIIV